MADSSLQLEQAAMKEMSDDEEVALAPSEDEEEVTVPAKEEKEDSQMNGVMVLALLDKIIGAVDQIQQTQSGLETRQQEMERSVTGIQSELTKLSKSHTTTANTVNKMLEKVRKVSVNVKSVRTNLEKQAGQIKRLESNENELLKRRNFKVMIYQDDVKLPSKLSLSKSMKVSESDVAQGEPELKEGAEETQEGGEKLNLDLSSDEEVEVEEIIEESRAERIKRSSLQRVDNIKKVFSKEKMEKTRQKTRENLEKTKQRTKENLEKTRQRTRENLEKTRQNIEKKMGKLGTRMTVNPERKEKLKSSRDKMKKSFTPDHVVYARSKTAVYKVPPFTFHVKKIREGEVEVQGTEMVEVAGEEEEPVEGGELLTEDSPEMQVFLETAEDSELPLDEQYHEDEKDSD
ncbi:polymerase I and transcript release factor-like [Scleropages formosus]|uniref:Polymerase I and transcript release factor-like n=2 Tax=Scleropages formosus TaxID=113540 RepID=A0A0P7TQ89_SCLFO|nr:caveolae-associated protein 1 [Scleropages formosus]XP_029102637.1 caveolae-associated protein 1 [Scleropages formosus]KPP63403.1 polymerase I and transcript release factor-like [Scleropages formosus]